MNALIVLLLLSPSDAEVQQAAKRILADDSYQTELPGEQQVTVRPPTDPSRAPEWDPPDLPDVDGGFSLDGLARVFFWTIVGVAAAVVLFWLVSELRRRRKPKEAPKKAKTIAPATGVTVIEPADLAREGRFDEAIHMLLLRVFGRLGARLAESWTSREVLRQVSLAPEKHRALEELVRAVEVSRFGGVAATESEYRLCVAHAGTALGVDRG